MNARFCIVSAALLLAGGPAASAQTLEWTYRTNGPAVQAAFESVRNVLQNSSAVIKSGRDEIAYGTVMSADGFILTKASEIDEADGLTVIVGSKTFTDPVVMGVDPVWDVALMKIPAEGLVPVRLALDGPDPERGMWVVANGATSRTRRRPQVGIIAASAREIPPAGGAVLGVTLEEIDHRLQVTEVHDSSGAQEAGIQAGDIIAAAGGVKVSDRKELGELINERRAGEEIALTVERDGEPLEFKVRLAGRAELFGEERSRNDVMSGNFSQRRSGFPRVIQHDIIANHTGMGGPLMDLDGRCLGMNIARASRCETFAIPAGDLRSLADRLITQATD